MENNEINTTNTINEPAHEATQHCCGSKKMNCSHCLVVSNIVLFIAVVVLFILHFTSTPKGMTNPGAKPVAVSETGQLKVAYINTDTLNSKYEYIKDLEKELQAYTTNKQNSLKQQAEQLQLDMQKAQTEFQEYLKTGDQLSLTQQKAKEAEFKTREADLQKRAERLSGLEQEMAQQIQKKNLEDNEKMIKAVYAFIREYNAANQQFNLILAKSGAASPVLYGDEAMDITNEILEGLNKEYKSVKKK